MRVLRVKIFLAKHPAYVPLVGRILSLPGGPGCLRMGLLCATRSTTGRHCLRIRNSERNVARGRATVEDRVTAETGLRMRRRSRSTGLLDAK